MDNLEDGDIKSQKLWMAIHEVGHIFREGGDLLVYEGVVTPEQLAHLRSLSDNLDHSLLNLQVLAADSLLQDLLL